MCGPCAKCYSSACRRGRSQQGCKEESAGEGATDGRELMRGRCVRMACVEGVTRAQRAAVIPGEPSLIELFAPVTVDGWACGIYPQDSGTRPKVQAVAESGRRIPQRLELWVVYLSPADKY